MQKVLDNKKTNLILLGLITLVCCFFSPSIISLTAKWVKWDQDLGHALPTLGFFIFLIWKVSPNSSSTHSKYDQKSLFWLLCFLLGTTSFIWYLFQSIHVELISSLLLIAALTLYIAACFSLTTAYQLLPILGLLFFVLPIWSEFNEQLIHLSSFVVGKLVNLIQLTAIIEGNTILIPSGIIQIADGCSGLRYLSISLLLGYILCILNGYNLRQSIITLLCATALGLLTNWIRIFSLVLIGYNTNMQSSLMHDHEMFGWILFSFIMMPAIYFAPIMSKEIKFFIYAAKCKPIIPTLFLAIGPAALFHSQNTTPIENKLTLNNLSETIAYIPDSYLALNLPTQVEKNIRYKYKNDIKTKIELVTRTPLAHEELVPYTGSMFNKELWMEIDSQPNTIDAKKFTLTTLKNINSTQKAILLYQFNVGNSATGSYRIAKLLQLKAKMLNENFFGLIAIQTLCKTDCREEMNATEIIASDWQKNKFRHP